MDTDTTQSMDATDTSQGHTSPNNETGQPNETQTSQPAFVSPFDERGVAKFKVDGQEIEADWNTIQRDYQLTKKSRMMMDEAAGIKRQAQTTLKNLYAAAQKDPEGFLRTMNPSWSPAQVRQAASDVQVQGGNATGGDSQQQLMEHLKQQLMQEFSPIKEKLEQYEMAQEREALNKELTDVTERFPIFKSRVEKQFLMSQYRSALENETGLSLEEVAFIASRELEEERREQQTVKAERAQQLKQKAPVITRPAGGDGVKKTLTMDDVKKLAGKM